MTLLQSYTYHYKSTPLEHTLIVELKLKYKDGTIRRGYKNYLIFNKKQKLIKIFKEIDNYILYKNLRLESWQPVTFLYKVKKTNGLPVKRPVEKKRKRKTKKKFQTTKEFNPKSKFISSKRNQTK